MKMSSLGMRRDRSRSPQRSEHAGRRREHSANKKGGDNSMNSINSMSNSMAMNPMMMNNMYQQGNMMMQGGMYPNMMMQGTMMGGGMMQPTGMEIMPSTGMEMVPQPSMDIASMGNQQMTIGNQGISAGGTGAMDMNMMGGMMMDPSMMGMTNMGMYPNMGTDMSMVTEKKEYTLKNCKLIPPPPTKPEPPRRTKPLGCRTIFVGGLPDKTRENTVRDIFENFGRIQTLRLSKKNFCHIRFDREECVDAAMQLSGYNIIITEKDKDKDDDTESTHAYSGWLHVDYALSRDDQNEYERRQRHMLRVQQAQMEQLTAQQQVVEVAQQQVYSAPSRRRSPSPLRIQPYSTTAVMSLSEKVKSEENFQAALPTLVSWLERGECSKKNANQFYSMLQATNAHIRRLFNEKMQAEDELQDCRERVKCNIEKVINQLEQVARVFNAATHQRAWDHFTKPQRKNIETWHKMTQEFGNLKDEFIEKFDNEDNDYNGYNKAGGGGGGGGGYGESSDEVQRLKLENDSLHFQLEAYKNEVDVMKVDAQKEMEKFKAQFIARQALQGHVDKNPPLPQPMVKPPPPPPLPEDLDSKVHLKEAVEAGCGEAKLIGVMSAFLQVHPQGASLDYVVSYVRGLFAHVSQATVHHVLQKHADVFQCKTTGVGANIEHRWSFVAYEQSNVK